MNNDKDTFVYYLLALPLCVLIFAGWKSFFISLGICVGIGVLILLARFLYEEKVERPKRIQMIEEWKAKALDEEETILKEHDKKISEIDSKYGECVKSIEFNFNTIYHKKVFRDFVRVYPKSSVLVSDWGKIVLNFSDIVRVYVQDDFKPIQGPISSQTTTSGKSMLERAAAGYVIAGGVGAVIGGATAKQETTFTYSANEKHDFNILVNTKDFSNPLVKIHTGDDMQATQEIEATILAIIGNNTN